MIAVPTSLKVERNEEREGQLAATARRWIEAGERTPGIHASDLIMPRKGYWKHFDQQPLSDREVGLFMVGKVLHSFILHEGSDHPLLSVTDEGSRFDEELGLSYSPDKLQGGKVIEVKTSRAQKPAVYVDDLGDYVTQVLIYLACERVTEGEIWVLYLNARVGDTRRTSPAFRVFTVSISPEELVGVRRDVAAAVRALQVAIDSQDHRGLGLCPAWACKREQCGWYDRCQPEGRWEPA